MTPTQSIAGHFNLLDSYLISSVEGWLGTGTSGTGLTISIYDNGSDIFGNDIPGSELYSESVVNAVPRISSWVGVSGLSWSLLPGTYWATYEVRDDSSTFQGYMPHNPGVLANPLDEYAIFNEEGTKNNWEPYRTAEFGVRIQEGDKGSNLDL